MMRRSPMLIFLVIVLAITYREYARYVVVFIAIFYAIRMFVRMYRFVRRIITNLRISNVDTMDGLDFEKYIASILKKQGYSNISLTEQYDYSVDIIATRDYLLGHPSKTILRARKGWGGTPGRNWLTSLRV